VGDAVSERRIGGSQQHRGRELQPRDALALCGFIVGAAAIGAALSPFAVLCALFVIVVETTHRLFELKRRKKES